MTVASPAARVSPLAVFRNPNFTKMWLAQLVSTIGDSFTMIASGILIYRATGSALSVGLMLMATSIPTLLIGMIAGVFVDRFDRKKIMITSDIIRGLFVLSIPFVTSFNVNWLYVMVMMASAVNTFYAPAFDSVMPEFAKDEELNAANSMLAISSFGSTAVGFAASGFLAQTNINIAFYIDGLSFFLSTLLVSTVAIPKVDVTDETTVKVVVSNLKSGLNYLFNSAILRSLFIIGLMYSFFVGLGNSLLLPFTSGVLKATEFEYGLQEGLTSIGFVVGSLLIARFSHRLREGLWIIIALFGMGISYWLYANTDSVAVAIAVLTVSGIMNAPYAVARRTLVQRGTEREVRGRVSGAFMTINHVIMLLGMGAAGLADLYGVRLMVQVSAIMNVLAGAVAMVTSGIGQPAAEWIRSLTLLRQAAAGKAAAVGAGRPAVLADFDRLALRLPAFSALTPEVRQAMLKDVRVVKAAEGSVIITQGETSDSAYFLLEGSTIAGQVENEQERILEVHSPGDFFGEIAALTGMPRTANVFAAKDSELMKVPAETLREMQKYPKLNRTFMSKMTERMIRMDLVEMPKRLAYDQNVLRELRQPEPEATD